MFVGRDGLCHDVDDPLECRGGRRLYYTAYGDPICDCPIGQFPFPRPQDDCVALFTQGKRNKVLRKEKPIISILSAIHFFYWANVISLYFAVLVSLLSYITSVVLSNRAVFAWSSTFFKTVWSTWLLSSSMSTY